MRIIEPSFTEIYNKDPQKHIEEIARTCYKSNNLITEDSNKKFIKNIYNRKHWAMLEHFIFIYQTKRSLDLFKNYPYIHISINRASWQTRNIISFNARALLDLSTEFEKHPELRELIEKVIYDYNCYELFGNNFEGRDSDHYEKITIPQLTDTERWIHGWKSIKFICDRGVSHELVRHRDASFAQESTRYCDYSKGKFGNELTFINPCYWNKNDPKYTSSIEINEIYYNNCDYWEHMMNYIEDAYFNLLNNGATAQEARAVLPNSLKTEVIMTTRYYEWGHFFELRCDKPAHPQMRQLALPLYNYFMEIDPSLFNDNNIKFEK